MNPIVRELALTRRTTVIRDAVRAVRRAERPVSTSLAVLLGSAGLLAAASPATAQADSCPNNGLSGFRSYLPDCRAYEMVSPLEKNGGDIVGIHGDDGGGVVQASADGGNITYVALTSFEGSQGAPAQGAPIGSQYLSSRGPAGWGTENITTPMQAQTYTYSGDGTPYVAFSTDLTGGLLTNGVGGPSQTEHAVENAPLDPNAPAGYRNYYLREALSADSSYHAVLTSLPLEEPPESPNTFSLDLVGATPDLKHAVVDTAAALTPGATHAPHNLYEWGDGRLQAVNVLPGSEHGETAAPAALGHGAAGDTSRAVSDDGRRVFWTVGGGNGALYVREFGEGGDVADAKTLQVDTSHGSGNSGSGEFRTASSDGSRAFFVDANRLTPDSTAGFNTGENHDLYAYDVESGKTRDLTVDPEEAGAAVLGVVGASEDGSYVYFVARGALAAGTITGAPNLYMWHDGPGNGSVALVATLSVGDVSDWTDERSVVKQTSRVSPDGRHVVFMSRQSLTGFDNTDAVTGQPDTEVFSSEVGASGPVCVSCNRSGARPIGDSTIPGGDVFNVEALYRSRVLSADGSRVFFDSNDALVPQDTNGRQDVYEWEQEGAGSCPPGHTGGCVSLISGGTSNEDSAFVDASSDGSSVFFIIRQQLVPGDTDQLVDLYDARVGGGFPQPASPVCTGTGCQGLPSAPPVFATPPSGTASGVGNYPPPQPTPAAKPKPLTRAQKLAKALKACRGKHSRRQRMACERKARKTYRPSTKRA
jgi:hypothetical protein